MTTPAAGSHISQAGTRLSLTGTESKQKLCRWGADNGNAHRLGHAVAGGAVHGEGHGGERTPVGGCRHQNGDGASGPFQSGHASLFSFPVSLEQLTITMWCSVGERVVM